jgi:hypothetical protein
MAGTAIISLAYRAQTPNSQNFQQKTLSSFTSVTGYAGLIRRVTSDQRQATKKIPD